LEVGVGLLGGLRGRGRRLERHRQHIRLRPSVNWGGRNHGSESYLALIG
jgi:hypothetical protein